MSDLLIQSVRPWGNEPVDVTIHDGIISGIHPAGTAPVHAESVVVDGGDRLLLPSFSDVHVHLDSTRIGLPFRPHTAEPGSLWNMIANDRAHWRDAEASVADRATHTLGSAIAHGMTMARSYAQVDADCRLERLEGVLAAREAHAHRADVQIVAFPQAGILREPGVPDLLDQALRAGAEVIGGIDPCALDADPRQHLDTVFALAEKHGSLIDIHLHEAGELGHFSVKQIIERVRALDMRGRVTIAHAFCLADLTGPQRDAVLDDLAELDIAVTTIAPGARAALPMAAIRARGIRYGLGQDGQRDYWSPYGNTDMLHRTWQLAFTLGLRRDSDIEAALDVATLGGRDVLGVARSATDAASGDGGRGVAVGDPADLVLVPGETPTSAIMDQPGGRTVVHAGRVVADQGELL